MDRCRQKLVRFVQSLHTQSIRYDRCGLVPFRKPNFSYYLCLLLCKPEKHIYFGNSTKQRIHLNGSSFAREILPIDMRYFRHQYFHRDAHFGVCVCVCDRLPSAGSFDTDRNHFAKGKLLIANSARKKTRLLLFESFVVREAFISMRNGAL